MYNICVLLLLALLIVHRSFGSPFLYNVASVLTSASGSSSVPQISQNVADLRKTKAAQLADEGIGASDIDFSFNEDPEINNGVVPGIIQQKVSKILRKFAYITMFANSGSNPSSTTDDDFDREKDQFDKEFEQGSGSNNNTEIVNNSTSNHTTSTNRDQVVLPNEITLFDENGRIEQTTKGPRKSLKINEKLKSQRQEEIGNAKAGTARFAPGDIGYFFTEILGSLIGLAYGAAAQFNRPLIG